MKLSETMEQGAVDIPQTTKEFFKYEAQETTVVLTLEMAVEDLVLGERRIIGACALGCTMIAAFGATLASDKDLDDLVTLFPELSEVRAHPDPDRESMARWTVCDIIIDLNDYCNYDIPRIIAWLKGEGF